MSAETSPPATTTPAVPAPAPTGSVIPPAKDATPAPLAEPNALMQWLLKTWNNIKTGQLGNPRVLGIIIAVLLIGGVWWFLRDSSRKAESALWTNYSMAVGPERIKSFLESEAFADSVATRIVKFNQLRDQAQNAMRLLNAPTLADRKKAATELTALVPELEKSAEQFPDDPVMKAVAYRVAARAEMALVGVPKENADPLKLDSPETSRGQISKVVELYKKASDAIGPATEAGKDYQSKAEVYEKTAAELYKIAFGAFSGFNNPDPVAKTNLPGGGMIDPGEFGTQPPLP